VSTPVLPLLLLGGLLAALGSGYATAQTQAVAAKPAASATVADTGGPSWRSLTPSQRLNLAPLERDWSTLDAARKAKWLEVSSRFATLPADEQQRVKERMAEWARLTPAERGQARLSFQEKKTLTSEQKQQRWEAYQALPDDHRRALAAKAQPVEDRKRNAPAIAVPGAGASAPRPGEPTAKRQATPATAAAASSTAAMSTARPPVKPVSPVLVQAKPGATTTLITRTTVPPAHQLPGQPRISAQPDQVDHKTLLPRSGPQAAASAVAAASETLKP
jgi:hypothetical protein